MHGCLADLSELPPAMPVGPPAAPLPAAPELEPATADEPAMGVVVPPEPDWLLIVGAVLPAVLGLAPPDPAVEEVVGDVGVELAGLPAVGALADMPALPEAGVVELGDVPVPVPAAGGGKVPAPVPMSLLLEHATQPKHASTLQPKRRII